MSERESEKKVEKGQRGWKSFGSETAKNEKEKHNKNLFNSMYGI